MITSHKGVAVIGVIAASGTGKTTLLRRVIPLLTAAKLRVGCVKHTHHPFQIDQPGKDSFELRAAGASQTLLGSAGRWALMVETRDERDAPLLELIDKLELEALDVVLVEGFRPANIPRIEVHRSALGGTDGIGEDRNVVAVVSDTPEAINGTLPVFDLNAPEAIAEFIRSRIHDAGQANDS